MVTLYHVAYIRKREYDILTLSQGPKASCDCFIVAIFKKANKILKPSSSSHSKSRIRHQTSLLKCFVSIALCFKTKHLGRDFD